MEEKHTPQVFPHALQNIILPKVRAREWVFEHFSSWKPHSCGMAQIKSFGHIERGKKKITILKPNRR